VSSPRDLALLTQGTGFESAPHAVADNAIALRCDRCGELALELGLARCPECNETLDVVYDMEQAQAALEAVSFGDPRRPPGLWRHAELLPGTRTEPPVGSESGWTPLRPAKRLGRELGLERLYLKDDTVSRPTLSYKDRVVSLALQRAVDSGIQRVACVSTGNVGNAVASHAARRGLEAWVVYPREVERAKIGLSRRYGANVLVVDGTYDEANRACGEYAANSGTPFANITYRAFYAEGAKTLAWEIVEQLGGTPPDHIVLPVAGATLFTRVDKGLRELARLGIVEHDEVRLHAAQAAGCAPIVSAVRAGRDAIEPVRPQTLAWSLAIGAPGDGNRALRIIDRRRASAAAASEAEILEWTELLGRLEGIWSEPAGGVVVAAARQLAQEGVIGREDTVVLALTGHGSKTAPGPADEDDEPEVVACEPDAIGAAIERRAHVR